ncbi:STAS-like domain-containing protein [Janthinobacterium fluminis]|uniref:STAS-like domain-containing protein n=1 Tax=Janthinobacterium fluminis TaxID=2987524 RepID=A0ABT5K8Y2_9BURK|nr:STAS-like domain-containing protein [Janthinobacterium fluminis]MDC8760242.1 STAS-like domain-containing protein [Janthinobacterium fluminis]
MTIAIFSVGIEDLAKELTTRPVGAQARAQLLALLDEHDGIDIDFHNRSLTPSFADECIGQLAAQLGLEDFKQRVKLRNLSASSRPLVKHVILTRCAAAMPH